MAFAPGDVVYVNYGEAPPCIHTRLVLDHVEGDEYLIMTPDLDQYVEELSAENGDFTGFHPALPGGAPPHGANPAHIYGFRPMTAVRYGALLQAGQQAAAQERTRRGLGVAPAPGAPAAPVFGALVWVLAEFVEGHKICIPWWAIPLMVCGVWPM